MVIQKTDPRYSKTRLRRPCRKCGNYFRPHGKFTTLCDNCFDETQEQNRRNAKKTCEERKKKEKWTKKSIII